jgi:hypothetical protein
MPSYRVSVLDKKGLVTHVHEILADSKDAIIRKAASLYRSRPAVEIRFEDSVVVHLTIEEMAAIYSQ